MIFSPCTSVRAARRRDAKEITFVSCDRVPMSLLIPSPPHMLTVQHNCHFYRVGASGHVGGLNTYYFSLSDIPESVAKVATSIAAIPGIKKIARCEVAQLKQTSVTKRVFVQVRHSGLVRNIDTAVRH